jgi:hypothetical protein
VRYKTTGGLDLEMMHFRKLTRAAGWQTDLQTARREVGRPLGVAASSVEMETAWIRTVVGVVSNRQDVNI